MILLSFPSSCYYRYPMVQIGQLLKYLSAINPQTSAVRLALYNFSNHFYRADQVVSSEMLNSFFSHALEYPHWQQNRSSLGSETQSILENLQNQLGSEVLDWALVRWPQDMQIVEIENFSDFTECIHQYLNAIYFHGEKFRLISDQQKKMLAVVLFPTGQVRLRMFDRKMTFRKGMLEPLRCDLSLSYGSKIELSEAVPHQLELAPYTCAQFEIVDGEVVGSAVRGYLFQKFQDFRGGPLPEHSKLFYSIKRLEQFFVDRRTDSFYLSLMDDLERTSNYLKISNPEAIEQAPLLLQRAEAALEQVFVGDKLLSLLVRDFNHLWQTHKANPNRDLLQKFVSTN